MQSPPLAQLHRVSVVSLLSFRVCFLSRLLRGRRPPPFFFRKTSCETCHPNESEAFFLAAQSKERSSPPPIAVPHTKSYLESTPRLPELHHGRPCRGNNSGNIERGAQNSIHQPAIRVATVPHSLANPNPFSVFSFSPHFGNTTTMIQSLPTTTTTTTTVPRLPQRPRPLCPRSIPYTTTC
jgi:hypothetical protein